MIVIAEDSVRFAHSGPSHNLLRPAIAELVSCGPSCPRLVKEGPSDISYRVTKRSSDRTLARPPCLQVPRWHPRVAKGSSDRTSARRPCPQVPQWHPRVAKGASGRSSARRPLPQVPQWHPRGATVSWLPDSSRIGLREIHLARAVIDYQVVSDPKGAR